MRSTPDPTHSISQFLADQHQYRIYATILRLGSGRSTLALGTIEAPEFLAPKEVAPRCMLRKIIQSEGNPIEVSWQ